MERGVDLNMSLYIINHQRHGTPGLSQSYIPLLLERPETTLQHRVYPRENELSHLLIDTYEITNNGTTDLYYPILPNPFVSLYFKFNHAAAYSTLCGATTSLSKILIPPRFTVFCVRFRSGTADSFSSLPAKTLTNATMPLEAFFSQSSELVSEIQRSKSFYERDQRVCQYLKTHLPTQQYQPHTMLNQCLDLIHERQGIVRVAELAAEAGCSDRYIGRIFQAYVGISPKLYCEIIQLQFSLQEILAARPKSLAKTAISYGYFDQPHMNRAYQKFLGRTASDMRFFDDVSCSVSSISVIL